MNKKNIEIRNRKIKSTKKIIMVANVLLLWKAPYCS